MFNEDSKEEHTHKKEKEKKKSSMNSGIPGSRWNMYGYILTTSGLKLGTFNSFGFSAEGAGADINFCWQKYMHNLVHVCNNHTKLELA